MLAQAQTPAITQAVPRLLSIIILQHHHQPHNNNAYPQEHKLSCPL